MLFDEDDASLLKKWIVKRLEDISDADSDVLADYVLALLRHDQGEDEVKQLCVEQLDDFLREHTIQFVDDVFVALATKTFRSVNSTLTGGGLSVHMPSRNNSPPMTRDMPFSPRDTKQRDQSAVRRAPKRSYFDRDDPERDDDDRYKLGYNRDHGDRDRGAKVPRRGSGFLNGRWTGRGGLDAGAGRGGIGGFQQPQPGVTAAPAPPAAAAVAVPGQPAPLFGISLPPSRVFPPWMPPPNPNDPMTAFLAAQAAAAWGFPAGVSGTKLGDPKKIVKKVGERCKDYDEKGFCMKGDMCPYEHGVDHIVVPNQESKAEEYDPNDSMLFSTSAADKSVRGGRGGSIRGRGSRGSLRGGRGGRAEYSSTGPSFDRTNTKLVVENIPDDKLTESTIKEFFSAFGTVDSVEILQHKNLAILKFTTWDIAKIAYDSPAPIFDNRFVKVFWYKPALAADGSEVPPTAIGNGFGIRRFSTTKSEHHDKEEKIDIEELKKRQEELQKAHEEKMAKKRANELAAKELQKRKEELMKLQAEEKRKLMEKLAKKHASVAATAASSASHSTPGSSTPSTNSFSAAKLEKSKVDATTAALKAQLEALQAEAQALGIDQNASEDQFDLDGFRGVGFRGRGSGRGRFAAAYVPRGQGFSTYRGRGTYAPRGRGGHAPTMKLDNRTKRVAVTLLDMKEDNEEEMRHYLINNGIELEAIDLHPEKENTRIFTFQDRRNAEKFVFSGNEIPNVGTVIMSWHNAPLTIKHPPAATRAGDDSGDIHMGDSNTPPSHHVKIEEDSYDLAEDDENRWLPE